MTKAERDAARAYVKAYRNTLAVGREQWARYIEMAVDAVERLEQQVREMENMLARYRAEDATA